MKSEYYFLIMFLFLFSCKEKESSQIIIAYQKDSIRNTSLCISSDLIQEWIYSPNWQDSKNDKYSEFYSKSDLMDSLKSIIFKITEIKKGQTYRIIDSSNRTIFVLAIDLIKHNESKNLYENMLLSKDYLLLLEFIKRQKYVPIEKEIEVSKDSIFPPRPNPPPRIILTDWNFK